MNKNEISRDDLIGALEVLEMVPDSGAASSQYLRVEQGGNFIELALASTILGVVRVPCVMMAPGTVFYVDRRAFLPFVMVGRESKALFHCEVGKESWILRQGKRKAEFVLRKDGIGGYGKWFDPRNTAAVKISEETKKLLVASRQCASNDPSLPALSCVYLDGQLLMASNMTTVFSATMTNGGNLNFPFPSQIIPLLSHESVKAVSLDGNRVIVSCRYGHLEGVISAVAKKGFPREGVKAQMERAGKWPVVVKLPCEALAGMMKRMVTYLSAMDGETTIMRLVISSGEIKLLVKTSFGTFIERDYAEEYEGSLALRWPLQLVKPVLEYIAENEKPIVVRTDERKKTPYLISGAGVRLMVARKES